MIVTFATDPDKITLCPQDQVSTRLINLGLGKTWRGFIDRLLVFKEYLRMLPAETLVLFTDAYDAVLTAPLDIDPHVWGEELETRFKAHDTDVLFSAETSCYPWPHVAHMYPESPTKYRYINGGGFVGYAGALLAMILAGDPTQSPCDQAYFTYYYLSLRQSRPYPRIKLDVYQTIFQTTYAISWSHFTIRQGRLYNTDTDTQPLLIHFNGNQFLRKDDTSIIPLFRDLLALKSDQALNLSLHVPGPPQKYPVMECPRDPEIRALAKSRAALYVRPDPSTIMQRDRVNFHAILQDFQLTPLSPADKQTPSGNWEHTNRTIVQSYFEFVMGPWIQDSSCLNIDVSLHDFVGHQMNTPEWPHSIFAFSTLRRDTHNLMIPDLYAMQHYHGKLTKDEVPTLKKQNRALFIGSTTGFADPDKNYRIQLCTIARKQKYAWLDAYISDIVNLTEADAPFVLPFTHPRMSIPEQREYRHILCVDGNTACWDRLPWVLASNSVCWKMESDHVCWYYAFLKPWVHYVPFTLDTLEDTWAKFKDDTAAQLRMVQAANQFVWDFLRPEAHALYTRTLIQELKKR